MKISARVSGHDRLAARLAKMALAPANSNVLDEAASIAANAGKSVEDELEQHGMEAEIRVVSPGLLSREIAIVGKGLWAFENGARSRPGTGALMRAIAGSASKIRRSIARRSREAIARAARKPATRAPAARTDIRAD